MSAFEILSLALTFLTVVVGVPAIVSLRSQFRKDRESKIAKDAVDDERMSVLREDVDRAHDKIRDIVSDNNNSRILFERYMANLDENTRVLHLVEEKINSVNVLEARLEAHLEAHR